MKLPYRFPELPEDEVRKSKRREYIQNGDIEGLKTIILDKERTEKSNEIILKALVADISTIPDCVGACLWIGGAHGYEVQELAIQHHDGTYTIQKWIDLSSSEIETKTLSIDLDLPVELISLRKEKIESTSYRNVDRKSGIEGRSVSLFVIVGNDAEIVNTFGLLRDGEYENNAANRILRAIDQRDDISLV